VNELSSALKRRFNVVVLPLPDDPRRRSTSSARVEQLGGPGAAGRAAGRGDPPRRHHLPRAARRRDRGRQARRSSRRAGTLSTAEAISVINSGLALAGALRRRRHHRPVIPAIVAAGWKDLYRGAVIKDPVQDRDRVAGVPSSSKDRRRVPVARS
jgi:hypothetical protein